MYPYVIANQNKSKYWIHYIAAAVRHVRWRLKFSPDYKNEVMCIVVKPKMAMLSPPRLAAQRPPRSGRRAQNSFISIGFMGIHVLVFLACKYKNPIERASWVFFFLQKQQYWGMIIHK